MLIGVGCDVIEIARVQKAIEREAFVERVYAPSEIAYCRSRGKQAAASFAARFAAKEAVLKALGTGLRGGDPAQWIEKLSSRVPCIHLKDYAYGRKMAVIGEGNINFDRVFEKAESARTKYMLIEQDDCNGENPFDCLKRSYEFLKSRGFK